MSKKSLGIYIDSILPLFRYLFRILMGLRPVKNVTLTNLRAHVLTTPGTELSDFD